MPYASPERRREYYRERRRMEREAGAGATPCATTLPIAFRLKTAADILSLLEEQVQNVRVARGAGDLDKARAIAYLASVALRAVQAGDLAARLEAVEQVLRLRKNEGAE